MLPVRSIGAGPYHPLLLERTRSTVCATLLQESLLEVEMYRQQRTGNKVRGSTWLKLA